MEEEIEKPDQENEVSSTTLGTFDFIRAFQAIGRSRRVIAQRPRGERYYQPFILDHVNLIDPMPRDPAGQYSERTYELIRNIFRHELHDVFERIETEEQKAEGRLKKINRNFFEKLKNRIKYTKDGITIDDQTIDNVGAATIIGNMVIAAMNESVEVTDSLNEKVNDFFKL